MKRVIPWSIVAVMLSPGAAWALTWNPSSSPLTVTGFGSTGKGYGSYTISTSSDGTRYRNSASLWLHDADNHKVYSSTDNYSNAGYCVAPKYLSCNQSYFLYNNMQSTHVNTDETWTYAPTSAPINGTANYHRGAVQIKLDVPWRNDPESSKTWTEGIPY